jgi:hypothetical protein
MSAFQEKEGGKAVEAPIPGMGSEGAAEKEEEKGGGQMPFFRSLTS